MELEHRKAIQSNYVSLVETTDLDAMVTALYEKGIFSEQMIEPYRETIVSQRKRKEMLYRDITRRGPHAFDKLLEVLSELGYWDLVRELDPNSSLRLRSHRHPVPLHTKPISRSAEEKSFVSISNRKHRNNTEQDASKVSPSSATMSNNSTVTNMSPTNINNNENPVPFVVKKSTKFVENDETKDLRLYSTRGSKRGILVVLSYVTFKDNIETFRSGVDVDCDNLKHLFLEIGFRVVSYRDLTLMQTMSTLGSLGQVLAGYECVFVVVSSHGYERAHSSDNDVRCYDGKLISLYAIIDYFNNRHLPQLAHVPKVFIFQICRGGNEDYVWSGDNRAPPPLEMPAEHDGAPLPPSRAAPASPSAPRSPDHSSLYSNILIAHSTLPGFVSHRDKTQGSWFVQALCRVFAARAHDTHVDKLFTLVDQELQDRFRIQTSSIDRWGFNRRLYLHPGLFDATPAPAP